jgi:hypothetical protein
MIRITKVALFLAFLGAACAPVERRTAMLGPGSDQCLDVGASCTRSTDCCSEWCVSSVCEIQDP